MAYPTVAEVRARVAPLADAGRFPDDVIQEAIDEFVEVAEEYVGVAFTPSTVTETVVLDRATTRLLLAWPEVTDVASVTVDGEAVTGYLVYGPEGIIDFGRALCDESTVVAVYTHGYATTPTVITRGCREYVRATVLRDQSGVPRDVVAQSSEGFYTRFATPSRAARQPTGYLEVDRLLNSVPSRRIPGIA